MRTLDKYIVLLVTVVGVSCERTSFSDPDQLREYVVSGDYPFARTIVKNGVRFELRYVPTDYLMVPEYKDYESAPSDSILEELHRRRQSYAQSIYFQLSISREDKKDIVYSRLSSGYTEYSNWLQTLLFRLDERITLSTRAIEELPLDTYHMERNFGMMPSTQFLLLFPRNANGMDVLDASTPLVVRMEEFGLGTGTVRFEFENLQEITFAGVP
jgi:hypothetical protein